MKRPINPRFIVDAMKRIPSDSDVAPPVGFSSIGKYLILRELGRGAMGVVYEGEDPDLRRKVAIKVIGEGVSLGENARLRFQREAQSTAAISHPNVVTLYDAGEHGGRMFLVMEYVEGDAFTKLLGPGPRDVKQILTIVEKIARGVAAAHAKGVIHRDLKPGNILMTAQGEPKVGDFGLAHWVRSDMALTKPGAQIGTPLYMAPEQIGGDPDAISVSTDVYALGAILYEAVTGAPPHIGQDLPEIFAKIVNVDPIRPRRRNPNIPRDVETICMKALEKDPRRRYRHAQDLADDLHRYLAGEPIRASSAGVGYVLWRRVRRNPLVWVLGSVAVLAVALLAVVAIRKNEPVIPPAALAETEVQAAYRELLKTLPAMANLEDHFHGTTPREMADKHLLEISEAVRALQAKYPRAAAPEAWLGLAEFYAGREAEGLARLDRTASKQGVDAMPHLLLARANLAAYVREASLPAPLQLTNVEIQTDEINLQKFKESPAMEAARTAAAAALDRALASGQTHVLEEARELQPYVAALQKLGRGHYDEAARTLDPLKRHPNLKDEIGLVRGLALLLSGQKTSAAETWEVASSRNWARPRIFAAMARLKLSQEDHRAERDTAPNQQQALADLNRALAAQPQNPEIFALRALVYLEMAFSERSGMRDGLLENVRADLDETVRLLPEGQPARAVAIRRRLFVTFVVGARTDDCGRDPLVWMERAIGEAEQLLDANPTDAQLAWDLALFNLNKAQQDQKWNRDPSKDLAKAIALYDQLIAGGMVAGHWNRGNALRDRGTWKARHGVNPMPDYAAAAEDFQKAVKATENPAPLTMLGDLYLVMADYEARNHEDPFPHIRQAIECYDAPLKKGGPQAFYLVHRASAYLQLGRAERAAGLDPLPSLQQGIADCTQAIQLDKNQAYYPTRAMLYMSLGMVEHANGKTGESEGTFKQAIRDFDVVIEAAPGRSGPSWECKGDIYRTLDKYEEALAAYQKALALMPDDARLTAKIEQFQSSHR